MSFVVDGFARHLVATGAIAVVASRRAVVCARGASRGRVGLFGNAADGSATDRDFGRSSDGCGRSDGSGFGIGRSETFRSDLGFLEGHLRLSELRVGSAFGSRRAVRLRRGSGATGSSSASGNGGDLSGRSDNDGVLRGSGIRRGASRHGAPADLPDFREAFVMDEVGLEIVKREKVVDAHARPESSREEELSIGGPFVLGGGERLSRSKLGERDSVPNVKVAGKLSKTTAHENATLRTPNNLVARFGTEVTKRLALAVVKSSLGGILAVSDGKVVSLGIPTHVVDGALLIGSNIAFTLAISRQVVKVSVSVVVVGT